MGEELAGGRAWGAPEKFARKACYRWTRRPFCGRETERTPAAAGALARSGRVCCSSTSPGRDQHHDYTGTQAFMVAHGSSLACALFPPDID